MNKAITIIAATIVGLSTSLWAGGKAPATDEEQVREVVNQHFTAIKNADRKALEKCWATEIAHITYTADGKAVSSKPITEAFKTWTKKPAADTRGTIRTVDVFDGRLATVKANVRWNSGTYNDYLTLVKTNGEWKLTAKTYTPVNKPRFRYGG